MEKDPSDNDLLAKWLSDELSAEDKNRLEENRELKDLKAVINDIDTWSLRSMDTSSRIEALKPRLVKSKVISIGTWMRLAASVALLVTAFYIGNYFLNSEVIIETGVAEKKEVKLPDGTIINLDARSSLSYSKRNWTDERKVAISGQVFLDVTSGDSFTVNTEKGVISVLGTEFNVFVNEDDFKVDCYEGIVEVQSNGQKVKLIQNQKVVLKDGKLESTKVKEQSPSWIKGFSSYDQAKLSVVMTDLEKYYPVELTLPAKYSDLKYTGRVTHNSLKDALRSVFTTMEIEYVVNTDGKVDFK